MGLGLHEKNALTIAPHVAEQGVMRGALDRHAPAFRQSVDDPKPNVVPAAYMTPSRIAEAHDDPHSSALAAALLATTGHLWRGRGSSLRRYAFRWRRLGRLGDLRFLDHGG